MAKLARDARRVERLTNELEQAREDLRRSLQAAHDSGETVSELARQLHVTRARVYQMLQRRSR
jgi:DNA-directed RNA polymerase specialized sigma subunit